MIGNYALGAVMLIVAVAVVSAWVRDLRRSRGPTQPLGTMARLYGTALVLYVAAGAYSLSHGLGGGQRGSLCVDTAFPAGGGAGSGHAARAGATIRVVGDIQACALHPTSGQWALFMLTKAPGIVVWGSLLLLIWRFISQASQGGPFTAQTATTMRQLGWLVIAGSMTAGALAALGTDFLTRTLMTPATYSGSGIPADILVAAFKALLPVPAIIGAVLLSFARITRVGAALDEEIKATV
jgi:Protein of unknown function (DUF2975)